MVEVEVLLSGVVRLLVLVLDVLHLIGVAVLALEDD